MDDGEPRSVADPANQAFIQSITRGELPAELDPGDPRIQVGGGRGVREGGWESVVGWEWGRMVCDEKECVQQ